MMKIGDFKKYSKNPFTTTSNIEISFIRSRIETESTESIIKLEDYSRAMNRQIYKRKSVKRIVDWAPYIQLYVAGVDALPSLSANAAKVLAVILRDYIGSRGKDMYYVNASWRNAKNVLKEGQKPINEEQCELATQGSYPDEILKLIYFPENFLHKRTYDNGLRDLKKVSVKLPETKKYEATYTKFIYETHNTGLYLINPMAFYNGNRATSLLQSNGRPKDEIWSRIQGMWKDEAGIEEYEMLLGRVPRRWDSPRFKRVKEELPVLSLSPYSEIGVDETVVEKMPSSMRSPAYHVKIYLEGLVPIFTLNEGGRLVFRDVFHSLIALSQRGCRPDIVSIHYTDTEFKYEPKKDAKDPENARRVAFRRGVVECLKNKLLARSEMPDVYFINPLFFFVGKRENLPTN